MATQLHLHHGALLSLSPTSDFDDGVWNLQRKTPLQLQTLENLYTDDKHPTQSRMEDYASALGLTYEQVRRWFIERRQRDKLSADKTQGPGSKSARNRAKRKCKMKNNKNVSSMGLGVDGISKGGSFLLQDLLYSPDYLLKKVFRKDGPPLGAEFDPLPSTAFQGNHGNPDSGCSLAACQNEQRESKRRKVSRPATLNSEQQSRTKSPMKKHGMGKGLMSVLQLMNSRASCQDNVRASERQKVLPCKTSSSAKKYGMGKGLMTVMRLANCDSEIQNKRPQRRKPVNRRKAGNKMLPKRKAPAARRKVDPIQHENQKARRECCKLALDSATRGENLCSIETLADDEELELCELQTGENPLTCSAHFTTGGTQACSLCKGFLPKFPPSCVRMKNPLSMHPWNSSLEIVKKLFKVFRFLYTYGVLIDVCPFTLDEFAQAFHEKDSLLIGKLHVCLLEFLLSDIEKELCDGVPIYSSKNRMFLNLMNSAEDQKFVVKFWKTSLNPLTWTEILRQVLVAAGFGSKEGIWRKGCGEKEAEHMVKYGLTPGTLKGELFSTLLDLGNKGVKVTELAKSSRIAGLNMEKINGELEDVICSTLASDITLFEKISSSAYRLRLTSIMKKDEESQSDNEDCGSIDDESRDCSIRGIDNSECDSGNPTRLDAKHHSGGSSTMGFCTEIDESHPGESWLLGLMEGEYSDLSIEEKLNAFLALIDLLSAGSSIRLQDPSRVLAQCIPSVYQHGSGGKIKRSSLRQASSPSISWDDVREAFGAERTHQSSEFRPVDSSISSLMSCRKEKSSSKVKDSSGKVVGDHLLHPMQSIFLGSDRRYNRYWLFLGPCDIDDPGHRRVYFESSEDGHWEVIDSEEVLCGLLAALNSQGRREAVLLASLEKRMAVLLDEMSSRISVDPQMSQSTQSDITEIDRINEDSPSPISDIDNILSLTESSHYPATSTRLPVFQGDKKAQELKQKFARFQAYDLWVWNFFHGDLHAVKHGKRSYFDSLTRCGSCHDLFWRDERHCKICHTTFELDFDLEEKYAVHVATCHRAEETDTYPTYKILSSRLQALKAAIHAIELAMPEDAFIGTWKKSAHRLWVRRLRRTSSLHELSQVLANFVDAMNADWLSQCNVAIDCDSMFEDIVACFQNIPQTSSAVALWLVKLDSFLASRLIEGPEVE